MGYVVFFLRGTSGVLTGMSGVVFVFRISSAGGEGRKMSSAEKPPDKGRRGRSAERRCQRGRFSEPGGGKTLFLVGRACERAQCTSIPVSLALVLRGLARAGGARFLSSPKTKGSRDPSSGDENGGEGCHARVRILPPPNGDAIERPLAPSAPHHYIPLRLIDDNVVSTNRPRPPTFDFLFNFLDFYIRFCRISHPHPIPSPVFRKIRKNNNDETPKPKK